MKIGRLQFQFVNPKYFPFKNIDDWVLFYHNNGSYRMLRFFGVNILFWRKGWKKYATDLLKKWREQHNTECGGAIEAMTKIKLEVAIAELKKKYQYQSSVDALLIGILIDHIEANSINTVLAECERSHVCRQRGINQTLI